MRGGDADREAVCGGDCRAGIHGGGAGDRFAAKKNLRLVEVAIGTRARKPVIKQVSGGMLVQDADTGPGFGGEAEGGDEPAADAWRRWRACCLRGRSASM
jgi:hypothetical protein